MHATLPLLFQYLNAKSVKNNRKVEDMEQKIISPHWRHKKCGRAWGSGRAGVPLPTLSEKEAHRARHNRRVIVAWATSESEAADDAVAVGLTRGRPKRRQIHFRSKWGIGETSSNERGTISPK